ncbi:S-adenosyl-L-methionine-dependent methyltransferase [Dichotomocladium elegans]|nr:S-adenosyl-L-methionine-dependent methyltransferase [Dichotomocladium elegans]
MENWPHILSQGIEEQDRMVTQHYILRAAFDGDFSAPVRPLLENKRAVVLDVGCGPGTWAMEMATVFPDSSFIGIDISENYPRDIKPKNCSFYTLDIMMERLPLPDNSVDYIFQRDLNWDMPAHKWPQLMREYLRILKPGGWIECIEQDIESQSSQSMECNINDKLIYGMSMRQQDPFVARQLPSILASNGFRRVESKFQSLSLGWDGTPLSKATTSQYLSTLQSLQPWLASVMDMTPERYSSYIAELPSEWQRAHTYINWHCAVAQKPLRTH